jgi:predicted phage tail protein
VWRDNATNETGFLIERSVNGGAFELLLTRGPRAGVGNVTFFDTGVAVGNTYAYRVAAVNVAGPSAYSNVASVALLAPAAPAALAATPNNLNQTSVTLTWTNTATNQTGFQLQRATNAAFTTGVLTQAPGPNATSRTQTGLARGTVYYYRIRAVNNITGPSAWSSTVVHTTL